METSFSFPLFPDPSLADKDGLVAVGGDLSSERLLAAYRSGIYPCNGAGDPILWWSPDPRGVFLLEKGESCVRINKTLKRVLKREGFSITFNQAFEQVIKACASAERPDGGHWITGAMKSAYIKLHHLGIAKSVEVWQGQAEEKTLAGGLYGVAIQGLFAGESMFFKQPNASKVALVSLVRHLQQRGYLLFDCQMVTETTRKLGAVHISRDEYLIRLKTALKKECFF